MCVCVDRYTSRQIRKRTRKHIWGCKKEVYHRSNKLLSRRKWVRVQSSGIRRILTPPPFKLFFSVSFLILFFKQKSIYYSLNQERKWGWVKEEWKKKTFESLIFILNLLVCSHTEATLKNRLQYIFLKPNTSSNSLGSFLFCCQFSFSSIN